VDSGTVAILVAVVTAVGTIATAVLSQRAKRAGAKVAADAGVLEGYDELTAHFRLTVQDLNEKNAALEITVEHLHEEIRDLRDDHAVMWHALRAAGITIPPGVTAPRRTIKGDDDL